MESSYEIFFSDWLHKNMPSSQEWFSISNIDYVICNYHSKKFIMIELKTYWKEMKLWQKKFYNMIHKRFMATNWLDWYKFIWTYLITFNQINFDDWFVFIEWTWILRRRINENNLKNFLIDILE